MSLHNYFLHHLRHLLMIFHLINFLFPPPTFSWCFIQLGFSSFTRLLTMLLKPCYFLCCFSCSIIVFQTGFVASLLLCYYSHYSSSLCSSCCSSHLILFEHLSSSHYYYNAHHYCLQFYYCNVHCHYVGFFGCITWCHSCFVALLNIIPFNFPTSFTIIIFSFVPWFFDKRLLEFVIVICYNTLHWKIVGLWFSFVSTFFGENLSWHEFQIYLFVVFMFVHVIYWWCR
jgi:hypothetical protein